jgi:CheY-like chemotaxis protein
MAAPDNKVNHKILVVDDKLDARRAMSELLGSEGFSVLTAANGLDGLHQLQTDGCVSLILLDLWMPVMDGFEFLRRKQKEPSMAGIPVVVLSAVPPVSLDGAEKILKKPVDPESLIDEVKRYTI